MIGLLFLVSVTSAAPPLRVWHSYRGAEESVLRALAAEAPEETTLTQVPFDTLQAKLMQALSVGVGPDVFIAPHERVLDWLPSLEPVPEIEFDIALGRNAFSVDGAVYGYPFALKALALVRNTRLAPALPVTLEALPRPPEGHALGLESDDFFFHSPFFFATGAELFGPGGRLQIDSQAALSSFAWLRSQVSAGRVTRGFNHTQLVARFKSGHLAAVIDGPWLLGDLGDAMPVAVSAIPPITVDGKPHTPRPFATVDGLLVPKGENSARAHRLARWLASPAHCARRTLEARALPPYRRCADAVPADDPLRGFYASLEVAVPMPARREMGFAWVPLKHLMQGVVSSTTPLDALVRQAQQAYDRLRIEDRPSPLWLDMAVYSTLALGAWLWWRRQPRRQVQARSSSIAYLLLAPGALFVAAFMLLPLACGALLSVFSHEAGRFHYVGLGNFLGLLENPGFAFTLAVTILWTVANLSLHLLLGVSLALLLDRPRVRGKRLWRAVLILPWAVPNYISALVFHNLFHFELGAINQLLARMGVARVDWFGSFITAFSANLLTNAWLGFPFVMVMTLGALSGIDQSLVEAMRLDGARPWQRFRHLTLPQIAPILAPAMLLSAMWTFNMFNVIYLVSGGEPRDETNILISEAYRWAFERGARYGYAAAYCVTIFVLLWLFVKARERMERARA